MRKVIKPVYGWAWTIDITGKGPQLCFWAAPSKRQLLKEKKPSPEAKPVRVKISVDK